MTIKEKLEHWKNTGECELSLEELCVALGKYEAIASASSHLPHMQIVIDHANMEANRIRDIIRGRDRRNK